MEIETLKRIIESKKFDHDKFIARALEVRKYYMNQNAITTDKSPSNINKEDTDNPLRKADNRVSHNYHQLLVDQKASYALTSPPLFDVDDQELNEQIVDVLGDEYPKISKDLAIDASNCNVAWLHVWVNTQGEFEYAVVDPIEIIPIFSKSLKKKLIGCIRVYPDFDETLSKEIVIYEYWDGKECHAFQLDKEGKEEFTPYNMFNRTNDLEEVEPTNIYTHDWAEYNLVPFIPFWNNNKKQDDLTMYQGVIDVFDKIYNGFVNDIEDVQEIIFILKGYGGTKIEAFVNQLKKGYLKLNETNSNKDSGVETLTIEIPHEARKTMLELTRQRIFEAGQGVDPFDDRVGNASGTALKFKYSLLELKTGLMQTEFMLGFSELVRFVLIHLGNNPKEIKRIKQTWTRTAINNDLEQAQVVSQLANVTSKENIAKSNPIVEDWEAELELLKKDLEDEYENDDPDLDSKLEENNEEDLDEQ